MSKYNPFKGKRTIKSLLKRTIKANGGEIPVEELLNHMNKRGYLKRELRRQLDLLDIEVIDGMARFIG